MKQNENEYMPNGFHYVEEEVDIEAIEAKETTSAYEMRADFRKTEGTDRAYEVGDTRIAATYLNGYNIADGLTEALLLGLSNRWIREEETGLYLHNVYAICKKCNIAYTEAEGQCNECCSTYNVLLLHKMYGTRNDIPELV